MKKVLVITYYWPPGGGAGVQRWLKFVKYLRNFGWEPIVYTPKNPEWPVIDLTLEKDIPEGITVLKTRIWEPYKAYKRFVGREKDDGIKAGFLSEKKNPSFSEKVSVWIRGNFFIPDARKFWVKPSVSFLSHWLIENPVDIIVSTGPPHSMHLIALNLHEKYKIPWLADFRDPWTSIDFYHELKLMKKSDLKHHKLEKEVLKKAERIVVISKGMAEDFRRVVDREYYVITNGFDTEDTPKERIEPDKKFSLAHIGAMVPARNPENLWKAIRELILEKSLNTTDLEIKLIGPVDYSVKDLLAKYELTNYTSFVPYLPHPEVIKIQQASQLLLLIINNTPNSKMVVTGKIFEYIASKRPILCLGPVEGDAARIISEAGSGITVDHNDLSAVKRAILNYYRQYKAGNPMTEGKSIEKYSRLNLTEQLSGIFTEMIG
jgi:hypothetical protein